MFPGLTSKPWSCLKAIVACVSSLNSIKASFILPGTILTSLNPWHCLNRDFNTVSSRFNGSSWANKIRFGTLFDTIFATLFPPDDDALLAAFSSSLLRFSLISKVPSAFAAVSDLFFAYWIFCRNVIVSRIDLVRNFQRAEVIKDRRRLLAITHRASSLPLVFRKNWSPVCPEERWLQRMSLGRPPTTALAASILFSLQCQRLSRTERRSCKASFSRHRIWFSRWHYLYKAFGTARFPLRMDRNIIQSLIGA